MSTTSSLQAFLSWAQEHGVESELSVQEIPDKGLGFVTKRTVVRDNKKKVVIPKSLLLNATKVG
ncbi:13148_t:CDS:2, partial [Acaulospora morrowiae]